MPQYACFCVRVPVSLDSPLVPTVCRVRLRKTRFQCLLCVPVSLPVYLSVSVLLYRFVSVTMLMWLCVYSVYCVCAFALGLCICVV